MDQSQQQEHKTDHQIQMEKCVENALAFIETRPDLIRFVIDHNDTLSGTGFMFSCSPLMYEIGNELTDDGHSGSSMAFTMRECQRILSEKYDTRPLHKNPFPFDADADDDADDYDYDDADGDGDADDYDTTLEINNNGCSGCIDEQPNQMAHMEPGGCLYEYDDFDDIDIVLPLVPCTYNVNDDIDIVPPLVPHTYIVNDDTPEPNVIEVESVGINGIGSDMLGQNWYTKMDDNNKEIMDVWAAAGPDAAVKAMFTDDDGVSRLSYSEMRSRYG